jgi:chorismate mutase
MSPTLSDLEDLRRRIDEIDDRLQDLLIERAAIVAMVATQKKSDGNVAALQPAREALIIRRLVERHRGPFPVSTLVRMWREMLAATVRMQSPFAVAVFVPGERQGYWDLARDHFGSNTPMSAYGSVGQVIRAVTEGQAAVGVLSMPHEGEVDPWWRYLISPDDAAPRIIVRLPFGSRGNARSDGADALAIGCFLPQPTDWDRTLISAETTTDISRARILGTLSAVGLSCSLLATYEHAGTALHLLELDGQVPLSDPRIDRFRGQLGAECHRLLPLGGYAVPLPAAGLAGRAPAAMAAAKA